MRSGNQLNQFLRRSIAVCIDRLLFRFRRNQFVEDIPLAWLEPEFLDRFADLIAASR